MFEILQRIESFRPTADDNWRELDEHVQALGRRTDDLLPAVPTLLRVFERYPRHSGHGVFWGIIHLVEDITGYEPILVEHVTRTPTEFGVTMLQRIVNAGIAHVGGVALAPLIAELEPRVPVIDYGSDDAATLTELDAPLAALAAFQPTTDFDAWLPLLELVAQLVATQDARIVTPLLQTLDRFAGSDSFTPWWPIVNGLEQLPAFPSALVASLQSSPTKHGLTLLLRLLAREVTHVDGVDLAALAADLMARG
jgi:hypothetical protein